MATRMQQRRATEAEWNAANPILAEGEIGFARDTKVMKLGDGVTPWTDLQTGYLSKNGGESLTAGNVNTVPLTLVGIRNQAADILVTRTENATGFRVNSVGEPLVGTDRVAVVTEDTTLFGGDVLVGAGPYKVGRLTPPEANLTLRSSADGSKAEWRRVFTRLPHTFTLSGDVRVAIGEDLYIPPWICMTRGGQRVTAARARHISRVSNFRAELRRIRLDGTTTVVAVLEVGTTQAVTEFDDVEFLEGDMCALVVTAVNAPASGGPKNATVAVAFDYEV